MSVRPYRWLLAIVILGAALRIVGLRWGLPGQGRFYHGISGHPDEQTVLYGLGQFSWSKKQFYPTDVNLTSKGTLQIYTVAAAMGAAYPWLHVSSDPAYYQQNPHALDQIYLVGRSVSVVQSVLAIIALFFLGQACFGPVVGLAAALLMAIAPVHVVNAHFISTDSAFCLYVVLLAWVCRQILVDGRRGAYWLAGILCGLLTANKYNASSTVLLILASHALTPNRSWRNLLRAAGGGLIAFAVACPIPWLNWRDFLSAIRYSVYVNVKLNRTAFPTSDAYFPANPFRFYFWDAPNVGLGWPLWAASLAALGYALAKPRRLFWTWFPWMAFFTLTLLTAPWRMVRWTMPLHPFLFLLAAWAWWETMQRWRRSAIALGTVVVLFTLTQSAATVAALTTPDPRDVASDWIAANIPPHSRIGIPGHTYFSDPSLLQLLSAHPEAAPEDIKKRDLHVVSFDWNAKRVAAERPSYIVAHDFAVGVYLTDPSRFANIGDGPLCAAMLDPTRYELIKTFRKRVHVDGLDWFGKNYRYPHDWRYPFPTIMILKDRFATSERR